LTLAAFSFVVYIAFLEVASVPYALVLGHLPADSWNSSR
jgi:hypothetical protein